MSNCHCWRSLDFFVFTVFLYSFDLVFFSAELLGSVRIGISSSMGVEGTLPVMDGDCGDACCKKLLLRLLLIECEEEVACM